MAANDTQPSRFDKENAVRLAEEEAWVQRASQGDQDALLELYEQYIDPLYGYFYSRVGSVSEAETLTSETFMRAVETLLRGHATWQDRPFGSWLYDTASNVLQEQNRTLEDRPFIEDLSHAREPFVPASQERSVLDSMIGEAEGEALWQLVRALPAAEQRILVMRHAHKLPYAEIAKRLRLSESACKRLHYRVLKKLKLLTQETNLWSKITRATCERKREIL